MQRNKQMNKGGRDDGEVGREESLCGRGEGVFEPTKGICIASDDRMKLAGGETSGGRREEEGENGKQQKRGGWKRREEERKEGKQRERHCIETFNRSSGR